MVFDYTPASTTLTRYRPSIASPVTRSTCRLRLGNEHPLEGIAVNRPGIRGGYKAPNTTEKRAPLWCFEQLGTIRRKLIQRAGRLTRPQGNLTLTLSANPTVKSELLHYLDTLKQAA